MAAEDVVAAYVTKLFVRSEAEARRPVVLLSGERTNVYGVLEKHFRETALPPSERFWRAVRTQWTPQLDTWRPRVNGTQLKVLSGARLPESEEEWSTLRSALVGVRQHLRPDSSVDLLHQELRDFVQMVVSWWENRKKTETGPAPGSGSMMLKRVASAGLLMGGMGGLPLPKKQCLEFLQLGPPHHPPAGGAVYQTMYAAPEIVPVGTLGSGSGSGRLPDPLPLLPVPGGGGGSGSGDDMQGQQQQQQGGGGGGTTHGGASFMQHLTSGPTDSQLFDQLFQPAGAALLGNHSGSQSPRDPLQCATIGAVADAAAAAAAAGAGGSGGGGGGGGAYHPQSPGGRHEGSADNQPPRAHAAPAADAKRFVNLNVGGHRFLTTAATLGAVEGSYFAKLAQQAGSARAGATSEFFVDRSGKIFEYVLDYLRSRRFADSPSTLPKDERTLQLLAREAEFYHLPELSDRARAALLAGAAAAAAATAVTAPDAAGDDTPSDVPANIAAEGSAHGGHLLGSRFGLALHHQQQQQQQQQQLLGNGLAAQQAAAVAAGGGAWHLDAVFVETGFQAAGELGSCQASLLESLNATVAAKQAAGFTLFDFKCGTERDGQKRNLHYHVLLRKPA